MDEKAKEYWNTTLKMIQEKEDSKSDRTFDKRSSVTKRGGRPYAHSPMEIEEAMWRYFYHCIDWNVPFTITGLCLTIGISRKGLWNLENSQNSQFLHAIKKARQIIEMRLEWELLVRPNPEGIIFTLKTMGWVTERDKCGKMP